MIWQVKESDTILTDARDAANCRNPVASGIAKLPEPDGPVRICTILKGTTSRLRGAVSPMRSDMAEGVLLWRSASRRYVAFSSAGSGDDWGRLGLGFRQTVVKRSGEAKQITTANSTKDVENKEDNNGDPKREQKEKSQKILEPEGPIEDQPD